MKKISSRLVLSVVVAIVAGTSGWLASEWIPPAQFAAAEDVQAGIDAYNSGRYRSAFWTFDRLAKQGDPVAQRLLAHMYSRGDYVDKSEEAAVAWWSRAAAQDDLTAIEALGDFYRSGSQPGDYERAAHWFSRSASYGSGYGMAMIGHIYLKGRGVTRDVELGRHWLERAVAETESSVARLLMGFAYRDGDFGERDPASAAHWCVEGAKRGNVEAMYCAIHLMVDDEDSPALDYETAYLWAILTEQWAEGFGYARQNHREYVLHGFRLPDYQPDPFPEPGYMPPPGERESETPRLDAAGQARAQLRADAILTCWPEPPIGSDFSIEECLQKQGAPAL